MRLRFPGKKADSEGEELAELSALADGTLDPARRAEAEARIADSPELRKLYQREREVVGALRATAASERAPARLRERIESARAPAKPRTRLRAGLAGAVTVAVAGAAVAVALVLPAGTPGSPSVSQAAALSLRGPARPPPKPDDKRPRVKLDRDVQDVYFPNWSPSFGWRAIGQRSDRLDGRKAVTIYYQSRGMLLAYTIVSAPALRQPASPTTQLGGIQFRTLELGGRVVVTWRRTGHTCVLSGVGVSPTMVRQLAAWKAPGLERD